MRRGGFRLALLLGLASATGPARSFAQSVREKVDVQFVTVGVTARDRSGRAVRDLKPEDFALSVDGKAVPIDTAVLSAGKAPVPRQPDSSSPGTSALSSTSLPPVGRGRQIAIFVDEGETKSFDRRNVYDELTKFLRQSGMADRLLLVARFDGSRLHIECPWTSDTGSPLAAIARMREHPAAEMLPTISELKGSSVSVEEVDAYRRRLFRALLEALALFPSGDAERQMVLVSGGTVFAHPTDIADALKLQASPSSLPWGPQRSAYEASKQPERDRGAFVLWSRAVNPGYAGLTGGDVVAKAIEGEVALIPLAAEPIDRDRSTMAATADTRTRDAGSSGGPAGTTSLGASLKPSSRLGVAQAMWAIAEETGGEPILSPGKTAARLAEIEDRVAYQLTFRDPSASDQRLHRIEITCRRAGVAIEYRRGYRIPTDEDRVLDTVVARLLRSDHSPDPFATAFLSSAPGAGRGATRVTVRFEPPRESSQSDERELKFVAVGERDDGERTEPVHWAATGRRMEESAGAFESVTDLSVPYGRYRWSIAITDVATGLTAFVYAMPP